MKKKKIVLPPKTNGAKESENIKKRRLRRLQKQQLRNWPYDFEEVRRGSEITRKSLT